MGAKKNNIVSDEVSGSVEGLAMRLLPVIARKKLAGNFPVNAGSSFFYEVEKGWETDLLQKDEGVCIAHSAFELEDAFLDSKIKTIFIACNASITKTVALRVCRRHGQGKTIFYEVTEEVTENE